MVTPPETQQDAGSPFRFVVDAHLGKLARHLRMLGHDTLWEASFSELKDEDLLRIAREERRALLTCDRDLAETAGKNLAFRIHSQAPPQQLIEVLAHFQLGNAARNGEGFLTRCLQCNSLILPLKPHQVADRVPGHLLLEFDTFYLCPRCEQVYWNGSHVARMREWIIRTLSA